jgi:hypothetical protein
MYWACTPAARTYRGRKLLGLHQEVTQVVLEGGEVLEVKHTRNTGRHLNRQGRTDVAQVQGRV